MNGRQRNARREWVKMANEERVGVIFEIIDDATPTLQKVKSGITEVDQILNKLDKTQNLAEKSAKKLGNQFISLRSIFAGFSIAALINQMIQYVKSAEKMVLESEKFNHILSEQKLLIETNNSSWERFKESVGTAVVNIQAANIEMRLENQIRKESIELLGFQNKVFTGLTDAEKEYLEATIKSNLEGAKTKMRIDSETAAWNIYLPTHQNVIQSIKNRISLMEAERNGTTELISLEIEHRIQKEKLNKQIMADKIETDEEIASRKELDEWQQKETETLKTNIKLKADEAKARDDNTKKMEEEKKKADALADSYNRLSGKGERALTQTFGRVIDLPKLTEKKTGGG